MKIDTNRRLSRRWAKGFSLLEMVIVMGIIALILGGAIYMMVGVGDTAKLKQAEGDMKGYENALELYKLAVGRYPTEGEGLKALVERPNGAGGKWQQQLKEMPKDPWGGDFIYRFPGSKNRAKPEMICIGPDGQPNTKDDFSNQD